MIVLQSMEFQPPPEKRKEENLLDLKTSPLPADEFSGWALLFNQCNSGPGKVGLCTSIWWQIWSGCCGLSLCLISFGIRRLWTLIFFGMKVGSFSICGGYDVRKYVTKCKFKYHKKIYYEVELKICSTVCCGTWRGEKELKIEWKS